MIFKRLLVTALLLAAVGLGAWLFESLRPPTEETSGRIFEISPGAGFRSIASELESEGFIRSARAFEIYAGITGGARNLQPGIYELDAAASAKEIIKILVAGPEIEATVTVPEGFTAADIDMLLTRAGVTEPAEFLALVRENDLEGRLFPDTYRFYFNSRPQTVLDRFLEQFDRRAAPLLAAEPENLERNIILASILEREVPDFEERRIVAGILIKRESIGMPLQVDASICYIKYGFDPDGPCEPITALDKKIGSPYNTYLNSGWPPGAISNPGVLAIQAALDPVESQYWYYLSDPKTNKTIFAETFNEHLMNQLKYLSED
jgi:UPF0755 protein